MDTIIIFAKVHVDGDKTQTRTFFGIGAEEKALEAAVRLNQTIAAAHADRPVYIKVIKRVK